MFSILRSAPASFPHKALCTSATLTVTQLKKIIPSLLARNPAPEVIREFVYLCRNMAAAYLRVKIAQNRLDPDFFGVSVDDLALDCVANLFERDREGQFLELRRYYQSLSSSCTCEEDLFAKTRRLVFSRVNESLFELYKEHDRSLSNVLRNLKIGLRSHRRLFTYENGSDLWVRTADSIDRTGTLPLLPSEMIESQLLANTDSRRTTKDLLDAFAELLQTQDVYRKQYPFVGLAFILRFILQRTDIVTDAVAIDPEGLTTEEVREFLHASVDRIHDSMRRTYLDNGKLDRRTYDLYFDTINDILESEFIRNDSVRLLYYDFLKVHLPDLCETEYMLEHRNYLEYLAKLARKEFLESISQELTITTKSQSDRKTQMRFFRRKGHL
jgi:hypothetical protein